MQADAPEGATGPANKPGAAPGVEPSPGALQAPPGPPHPPAQLFGTGARGFSTENPPTPPKIDPTHPIPQGGYGDPPQGTRHGPRGRLVVMGGGLEQEEPRDQDDLDPPGGNPKVGGHKRGLTPTESEESGGGKFEKTNPLQIGEEKVLRIELGRALAEAQPSALAILEQELQFLEDFGDSPPLQSAMAPLALPAAPLGTGVAAGQEGAQAQEAAPGQPPNMRLPLMDKKKNMMMKWSGM